MSGIKPWIKWSAFAGGCLLGAFALFLNLFLAGSDQISYIDIARVYAHGSWWEGITGYWSPLLPALVAMVYRFFHPGVAAELPLANAVLYFTFVFFLASYLFFHACLTRFLEQRFPQGWSPGKSASLFFFGFALALSGGVTVMFRGLLPDLLVAAFFLLASGLLARFLVELATWRAVALFGVFLAFGYLAKSVFIALAGAFILAFYLSQRSRIGAIPRTVFLATLFLAVTAVEWVPLSLENGRLTFGETGKIAYVLRIADKHYMPDSRLQTSPDGRPLKHPYQILMDRPLIFGFQGPVKGTYPYWYDYSYYLDGLHASIHPVRQLLIFLLNGLLLVDTMANGAGFDGDGFELAPALTFAFMAFLALLSLAREPFTLLRGGPWLLLLPCLVGFAVYGMTYYIYRYLLGFLAVLMCAYVGEALASFGPERARGARRISLVLFGLTFLTLGCQFLEMLHEDLRHGGWHARLHNSEVDTGQALTALNVPPGTPVATVGDFATIYFPDVARVRVLARIQNESEFWDLPDAEKQHVYDTLAAAGLADLISEVPARATALAGWIPIGGSEYILHPLAKASP